jgi:hypothetical protein
LALLDLKANALAFIQRPETTPENGAIVDKDVLAFVHANETIALFLVKPLHCTFCHDHIPPFTRLFSWDMGLTAKKATKVSLP